MKTCFKCGRLQPLSEFYRHSKMADGHLNKCKACARTDSRGNYNEHREYYNAYDRRRGRTDERKERAKEWQRQQIAASPGCRTPIARRQRALYPEKYEARTALGNALRDKRITSQPCEKCGSANAHGHHDDYSKPLDVRWLCSKHHGEHHRRYA